MTARPRHELRAWAIALAALAAAGIAPAPPAVRAEQAGAPPLLQDAQPSGPSVEERLDEIRRRLQDALDYPPIARRLELEGTAWLRFEIDRRGAPHGVEVVRSSGHDVLDRAARRTVDRAGPLPWVYGRIEVPVRFSLEGARH